MLADGMKMSDLFLNPAARLLSHPNSASCVWINMNVREWEENLTRLIKHKFWGKLRPGPVCPVTAVMSGMMAVWSVRVCGVARRGQAAAPAHTTGLWSSGCQEKLPPGPGSPARHQPHLAAITTNIT